mmetsp:Transcript_57869/g.132934  ORF Transcript_57869/g.132934 Transcript_57869/m.132934 type:complete len:231 (-) Transcript_57869:328-1020(-)
MFGRTVDLAHVLRDFGVRFRFLTAMPGVNPLYREEAFYKATIDMDSARVRALFDAAPARGIRIERRSLSPQQLQELVISGETIVMALVDRRRLYSSRKHSVSGFVQTLTQWITGTEYVGHYVLITAFDAREHIYWLKDPAQSAEPFLVPSADLDAARFSHGTDEDLIIIPWDQGSELADSCAADSCTGMTHSLGGDRGARVLGATKCSNSGKISAATDFEVSTAPTRGGG